MVGKETTKIYYSAHTIHSHLLSPTHLRFFVCNQIIISSCSACLLFVPPCVCIISTFCLELQLSAYSLFRSQLSSPFPRGSLRPTRNNLIIFLLPSVSTLPFMYFYCTTYRTILGSFVFPRRLTPEDIFQAFII